jgi:hypothetical protein
MVQYGHWLSNIFQGDLGDSLMYREPLSDIFATRMPITLYISALAFLISSIFGVTTGIICAIRRGGWLDQIISIFANLGIAIPIFFLGILGIYILAFKFQVLPIQGWVSPYNPEKAKKLLAEAGYPNGFKTKLNFYRTTQVLQDECTAIQSYLKAVGIECELNPLQRPGFVDVAARGKGWEGIARLQGYSSPDPLIKYAGVASGREFTGVYLPKEFTNSYNRALAAPNFKIKKRLVQQLMKLSTDKYCMAAHLYLKGQLIFKSKRVHDDHNGEIPYRYLNPKTWVDEK